KVNVHKHVCDLCSKRGMVELCPILELQAGPPGLCCHLTFKEENLSGDASSVLRRTVTLLTQLAKGMASHAALETQVNDATEAAKKYMAENERLQEALNEKGSGDNKEMAETTNGMLRKEIGQLKAELQKTSNGKYWKCRKAAFEVTGSVKNISAYVFFKLTDDSVLDQTEASEKMIAVVCVIYA
ncbi:hypothetical protein CIB84_006200, partial [Bambusicola thoracicus]